MSMGNGFLDDYMEKLESHFSRKTGKLLKKRMFRSIASDLGGMANRKKIAKARTLALYKLLNEIAPDGDFKFHMLQNLTRPQLRQIINDYIEPHVASNSVDYEYSHFDPETVNGLMEEISSEDEGIIKKDVFTKRYVDMGGNIRVAEDIWSVYGGDSQHVVFEKSQDLLVKALEKFELYRGEEDDADPDDRNDIAGGYKSEEKRMRPDFKEEEEEQEEESEKKQRKDEL